MESYKKLDNNKPRKFHKCKKCTKYESSNPCNVRRHIRTCAAKPEQKRASSEQNNETNGTSETTDRSFIDSNMNDSRC